MLMATGARKEALNSNGMSAYGMLMSTQSRYRQMMQAMMGTAVTGAGAGTPGLAALAAKLMPAGGPTDGDRTGGEGTASGFVDYSEEDAELGLDDY
jgi:hypothetical protein